MQTRATNHLNGYDLVYNQYDFTGKVLKTLKTHGINGASDTYKELYTYAYDNGQRLITTTYSLNGGATVTLASNCYDELGRLQTKKIGNNVDATIYSYNIQGHITEINGSKFSENLYYNANTANLPDFTPCYNGNIAGMKWNVASENLGYQRAYSFAYDDLNRLTNSVYSGNNGSGVVSGTLDKYTEKLDYQNDKMGNLKALTRYENGTLVNDLTLTYTGNQLLTVNNSQSPFIPYGSEQFNDRKKLSTEYAYDVNGNMQYDANGGVSAIQYNIVNLPNLIQFTEGHRNQYTYNASGQKLRVENYTVNNVVNVPLGTVVDLPTNSTDYTKLTTDINGNVMTTRLDNLGRVVRITGANEYSATDTSRYTLKFNYIPKAVSDANGITAPAYAITQHYDPTHPDNPLETVTFVDGMGRPIQVKKDGFVEGEEKMIVSGLSKYDALGRVIEAYYPTTEPMGSKTIFNKSADTKPPTKTEYDALDRPTKVTLPDGKSTLTGYDIAENLLRTTVTDALNHSQSTYTNGSGKTVKTVQMHNNSPIETRFDYDPINQLVLVTDAKGGQTLSEYDLAGRRTKVTHPASGTTTFRYDNAGNLIEKHTANLAKEKKMITYTYDFNRLKEIIYPNHPENNVSYVYGTMEDAGDEKGNRAGRLKLQTDGSGAQEFRYGKQGEITQVKRTLVIPNQAVATYTTDWTYDCWNRIQTMTYPDGEILSYSYNTGGLLNKVTGSKSGVSYDYVKNLLYDKFEQRTYMKYGNGAETHYTYDPDNKRLGNLRVNVGNTNLMNNAYTYDDVSNVTKVVNTGAAIATTAGNGIGGAMTHNYAYDDLYRLESANGAFAGYNGKTASYTLNMGYDNLHNITRKSQHITQNNVQYNGLLQAGYDLGYSYANNSQQISNIADTSYRTEGTIVKILKQQTYSYDANGNLLCINSGTKAADGKLQKTNEQKYLWDEDNRLLAVSSNGFVSNYWYDANGERTVKSSGDAEGVSVNGVLSGAATKTTNFTAYISPYTVVGNGGQMSKHIYIGSQRIVSKLINSGTMSDPTLAPKAGDKDYTTKYTDLVNKMKQRFDSLGVIYRGEDNRANFYKSASSTGTENQQYFYHSDHLGSSSLITDVTGSVAQHLEYVPYGEVFIDERNNSWHTPYLFSAKELDEETGLYFFGARYYAPREVVWRSVDPLAEKKPWMSSYVYCSNNPLNRIDPDGRLDFELPMTKAYLKGLWNGASSTVQAVAHIVAHPVETGNRIATAVANPSETGQKIVKTATETYNSFANGNAEQRAYMTGSLLGGLAIGEGVAKGISGASKLATGTTAAEATTVTNSVPSQLARVVPANIESKTLGAPNVADVFVTAPGDIVGLNAKQIAERLTIPQSNSGFRVIEFDTPSTGLSTPINRSNPGFVGYGRTAGGAREFTIPNQNIPTGATTKIVK